MVSRPSAPGVLLAVTVGLVVVGLAVVGLVTASEPPSGPVTLGGHQAEKSSILLPQKSEGLDSDAPQIGRRSIAMKGREARLGRAWQVDPQTCDVRVPPAIVVTSPAKHGRIEIRPIEFVQRRTTAACARRLVRGVDIFYLPDNAFVGTDRAVYRVILEDSTSDHEFTIDVGS